MGVAKRLPRFVLRSSLASLTGLDAGSSDTSHSTADGERSAESEHRLRPLVAGDTVRLDQEESHHLSGVLRRGIGDSIEVIDLERHAGYRCTVESFGASGVPASASNALCLITEVLTPPPPPHTTLIIGLPETKIIESVVEKAVEIGIHAIWLAPTSRSQDGAARVKKSALLERLSRISIAALKQCGAFHAAEIRVFATLELAIAAVPQASRALLLAAPGTDRPWQVPLITELFPSSSGSLGALEPAPERVDSYVLIGPEGGLTNIEEQYAVEHGFLPCSVGPQVLRTETAAIVALTLVRLFCEIPHGFAEGARRVEA